MELVRELQAPSQRATTTQEISSRETEEEQPQMEVTEADAEPEAEQETEEEQSQMEVTEADAEPEADQEEADQMRDTDVASAAATSQTTVDGGDDDMAREPCWKKMTRNQRKRWKKFGGREE